MRISTVSIPWEELHTSAVDLIRSRLAGYSGVTRTQLLTPRLLIRSK